MIIAVEYASGEGQPVIDYVHQKIGRHPSTGCSDTRFSEGVEHSTGAFFLGVQPYV